MKPSGTDKNRLSLWGIGPTVSTIAVVWGAGSGAATFFWPQWFSFHWLPYPVILTVGLTLAVVGTCFQIIAGRALLQAYNRDTLVTTGVYAICRNPLYANIIFTLLPAIALVCNSWLMLTSSVVMYILTRLCIRREEVYLENRFGQAYLDYRKRTNALFPTIGRQ